MSRRSTPDGEPSENWYHGAIDRNRAKQILDDAGFSEGLFLVRQSMSSDGDYVLSVVHQSSVIHYQIRKRGEDALFSLSEEQKVIHGLDELVEYYRHEPRSGLQHSLNNFVQGHSPPPEAKLHGTENLLHRSTVEGDLTVVVRISPFNQYHKFWREMT